MTTSVWDELAAETEPLIVNGRYVIDGKKYTRVTTFIGALDNAYGLSQWRMREVAKGIANSGSLRAELHANVDDHRALDDICERAIQSVGSNEKRDLGSAIHRLTEMVDDGTIGALEDGDPLTHAVNEYRRLMTKHGLTVEESEQIIVCEELGVAGRFDRAVMVPDYHDPLILDVKTGRQKNASFARQFAIYAHADFIWNPITNSRREAPKFNKSHALAMMLPTDGVSEGEILVVDIAQGWEDAKLCKEVRERGHRTRNDLVWPLGAVEVGPKYANGGVVSVGPTFTVGPEGTEEVAFIPLTKTPTKITPDAVSDTDAETMRVALSQRIADIKATPRGLDLLKSHWPSSVTSKPWPSGQLGAIASAVHEVEQLLAKPEDWWALQDRFKALDPAARSLGRQWSREADEAGTPLHTGDNAAHRRIVNVMCMLLEATDDADVCRDVIGLAMADDIQPAVTLGAAWAALTDAELDAVARFATAYRLGVDHDGLIDCAENFDDAVAAMFAGDAA